MLIKGGLTELKAILQSYFFQYFSKVGASQVC